MTVAARAGVRRKRPRVLLVEDEAVIAMLMEDMLLDLGLEVTCVVSRLEPALAAARSSGFDVAVLDVNLAGSESYKVAEILAARGLPFAFVTGYGMTGLDPAYGTVPVLQKPFRLEDLQSVVARLLTRP